MILGGAVLLIVAILLFGAGAVRGALGAAFGFVVLVAGVALLAFGLEWDAYTIMVVGGTLAALVIWGIIAVNKP